MNDGRPFSAGVSLGVIVVFVTTVLAVCLLLVFLYNLPVLFPPPGTTRTAGQATLLAAGTAAPATPTQAAPPSQTLTPPADTPTLPAPSPSAAASAVPLPLPTATLTLPAPVSSAVPARGQIIFVAQQNGSSIMTMDANGSSARLLVPHRGNSRDYAPAVSPDGTRLAFSSNRDRRDSDDLYVMNLDGTRLVRLTSTRDAKNTSAAWYPDGHHIAFVSDRSGRWQAYAVSDDGRDLVQLIRSSEDVTDIAVSPRGDALAYTCGREICLANGNGDNGRSLFRNGIPKTSLAWSPDARLLAFTQRNSNDGRTGIYTLDLQGNARQVVGDGGPAAWSPDGTRLLFSADKDGGRNLYAYNLTTHEISRVSRTRVASDAPVWIPQ